MNAQARGLGPASSGGMAAPGHPVRDNVSALCQYFVAISCESGGLFSATAALLFYYLFNYYNLIEQILMSGGGRSEILLKEYYFKLLLKCYIDK
jgi:hypothetical protein